MHNIDILFHLSVHRRKANTAAEQQQGQVLFYRYFRTEVQPNIAIV